MDIKFENKYTRDERVMKEFFAYHFFKKPSSFITIFIISPLLFVYSLYMVIALPSSYEDKNFFFLMLVVSVVIVVISIFGYYKNTKTLIAREREMNGGELFEIITSVTDDSIIQSTEKSESKTELSCIKAVILTKNLIIFMTKTKLGFILKRDSFTVGTDKELLKFVEGKSLKIKKSQW